MLSKTQSVTSSSSVRPVETKVPSQSTNWKLEKYDDEMDVWLLWLRNEEKQRVERVSTSETFPEISNDPRNSFPSKSNGIDSGSKIMIPEFKTVSVESEAMEALLELRPQAR